MMTEYTVEDEDNDDAEIAAKLVRDGWKSTSNKHRVIARLPEGKTGLEALREVAPDDHKRIMENAERQAADTYRRLYANWGAGTSQILDSGTWSAFKRAGGQSSW